MVELQESLQSTIEELTLRLRRLEVERQNRLAEYEREPSDQRLDAYRAADRAYLTARGQVAADLRPST